MDFGRQVLSSRCSRCNRIACPRCQDRTCLSCKRNFTDRSNVELITEYGVCLECGILLTGKYLSGDDHLRKAA